MLDETAQAVLAWLALICVVALVFVPMMYLVASLFGSYSSRSFWPSTANVGRIFVTLFHAFPMAAVECCVSIFLAALLWRVQISSATAILLGITSFVLPPIAVSLIWKLLFDYNSGMLNVACLKFFSTRIPWLSTNVSPVPTFSWVDLSIAITDFWLWLPFLTAAIFLFVKRIPSQLTEAAMLEGASPSRVYLRIILPQILVGIALLFSLRLADLYRLFDQPWAFLGPNPEVANPSTLVYALAYSERDYQAALGVAVLSALVITPVSAYCLHLVRTLWLTPSDRR